MWTGLRRTTINRPLETRPKRVIYNFVARCNMACTFCYVPFDKQRANAVTAMEVLNRVLSWNIEGLVVGGGDPLMYDYTLRLLQHARKADQKLFIQLDTNAWGRCRDRLMVAARYTDLVGLPIDGINQTVCAAMRGRATHGVEIAATARLVALAGHAVKINTVVSSVNRLEISRIRRAVKASGARIWSLYQFWPIGNVAVSNAEAHAISAAEYQGLVRRQRLRVGKRLILESSGSVADRAGSYFFVAPTGRAFCTTPSGSSFIELGNLLHEEDAVLDKWRMHADLHRNRERSAQRERILNKGAYS